MAKLVKDIIFLATDQDVEIASQPLRVTSHVLMDATLTYAYHVLNIVTSYVTKVIRLLSISSLSAGLAQVIKFTRMVKLTWSATDAANNSKRALTDATTVAMKHATSTSARGVRPAQRAA